MTPPVVLVILTGAAVGLGFALILRELTPAPPALDAALRRLRPTPAERTHTAPPGSGWAEMLLRHVRVPHRELVLIGHSVERHLIEKVSFSLVGLAFPAMFSLILAVAGLHLGVLIPAAAGLGLAVLFWFLVDVSVRQRANQAREEFSHAVAVYLDLVALELAASHGPSEALERAAAVSSGWVSQRIREALHTSRLRLESPWDGLKQVADDIGVPDLGDVGEIMTLSGEHGAQVYDTLRSRSRSLRTAILAKEEERANTATTVLYIPTSLLVFVLFVIAAYPFLIRLVTT